MHQHIKLERNKMKTIRLIEQWAEDRNLIKAATDQAWEEIAVPKEEYVE